LLNIDEASSEEAALAVLHKHRGFKTNAIITDKIIPIRREYIPDLLKVLTRQTP
jgi:hypothetical protein